MNKLDDPDYQTTDAEGLACRIKGGILANLLMITTVDELESLYKAWYGGKPVQHYPDIRRKIILQTIINMVGTLCDMGLPAEAVIYASQVEPDWNSLREMEKQMVQMPGFKACQELKG